MGGGSNLGDAVETLHVAVVDEEVKVSLGGGGEGGMPHHLTVQFAVGVHHTWGGGAGGDTLSQQGCTGTDAGLEYSIRTRNIRADTMIDTSCTCMYMTIDIKVCVSEKLVFQNDMLRMLFK